MGRYNNGMPDRGDIKPETYRQARQQLGLPQAELAKLAGVTQPAIAAYEAGRRRPTGRADFVLGNMVLVVEGAEDDETMTFPDQRFGTYELPARRWRAVVPPDAVVRLPTRLDWSHTRGSVEGFDLSDHRSRASVYAQVLDEGLPKDIRFWIDPDALVDLWPDVPVARRLRPHIDTLVEKLMEEAPCAA